MTLLVGIKSCRADQERGAHDLVRSTWQRNIHVRSLFFMGQGSKVEQNDEIVVDAPDDYLSLPLKTKEIVRFALEYGYEHLLLVDTGSFVHAKNLKKYDYDKHDYLGHCGLRKGPFPYMLKNEGHGCPEMFIEFCHRWASGGGYFLSRKAMEIVANAEPVCWAEDCGVGQILAQNGIFLEDRADKGYKGLIVDWIENERNNRGLDKRREWMMNKYKEAHS